MIKRALAAAVVFAACGLAAAADWKADLVACLGPKPDYRRAQELLSGQAKTLETADRQTVDALLPYLASKLGDAAGEQDLIADYFEKYSDNDPEFGFLDDGTHRDFLNFWGRWKTTYPLVTEMDFLSRAKGGPAGLPAGLEIGLTLLNGAFYKLSLGPYALEGGFWSPGFHIVSVPAAELFERSGTYEFALDLKAGDIVVRKPIRLEVNLTPVSVLSPPAPSLPPVEGVKKPGAKPAVPADFTGEIALYVGGKLVMVSRKIAVKPRPFEIPIPGPSMPGQKPYLPPPKTDPMANSISILDVIASTYKTLKDLLSKKPPPPSPPSFNKVTSLSFTFARTAADGLLADVRADVRLEKTRTRILRE